MQVVRLPLKRLLKEKLLPASVFLRIPKQFRLLELLWELMREAQILPVHTIYAKADKELKTDSITWV
jgi:hypothetical protein